jgi:hypothetical protein
MDQNFTDIRQNYPTPTSDEVQRMIELAFFQREHENISRDRRIAALEAENADPPQAGHVCHARMRPNSAGV